MKNKIDSVMDANVEESSMVKMMLSQNISKITKVLDVIRSCRIFNSSFTSSNFGRLNKNLMMSPTYLSVLNYM